MNLYLNNKENIKFLNQEFNYGENFNLIGNNNFIKGEVFPFIFGDICLNTDKNLIVISHDDKFKQMIFILFRLFRKKRIAKFINNLTPGYNNALLFFNESNGLILPFGSDDNIFIIDNNISIDTINTIDKTKAMIISINNPNVFANSILDFNNSIMKKNNGNIKKINYSTKTECDFVDNIPVITNDIKLNNVENNSYENNNCIFFDFNFKLLLQMLYPLNSKSMDMKSELKKQIKNIINSYESKKNEDVNINIIKYIIENFDINAYEQSLSEYEKDENIKGGNLYDWY